MGNIVKIENEEAIAGKDKKIDWFRGLKDGHFICEINFTKKIIADFFFSFRETHEKIFDFFFT